MKFTDGYWQMRKGVTPVYPAQALDVEQTEGGLRISAPTVRIAHRGQTLNRPMLTIELSTPMEDIIGVRAYHFEDGTQKKPAFEKQTQSVTAKTHVDAQQATLTSGELCASVERDPYSLTFSWRGRKLTDSASRNLAYITDADDRAYMIEQLRLGVGENVYGLGERFTPLVKNGQSIDLWNEDGGTASEIAYKNIPFYITNRGYGVFIDHPERVFLEVGSEKVTRVSFGVPGEEIRYYIIAGDTPAQIMERYTALTGRPALPPAWSFGLWLSTSFTTNYDELTTSSFIDGMAQRDIPLHVFHFDCFWMREFNWCDFQWDDRVFPDPEGMLRRYREKGLKICVWINPYIAQRSPLFAEGKRLGYLLRRPNGDVWQCDLWQAGMGLVDFTNPDACAWYAGKLKALLDMGVDCFKTDFGERIPTDVVYHDGSDPQAAHNYYTFLYNKCVFDLLVRERGEGDACLFARSATAGGQQFPVHWGGDCMASYESMAETLRGGLSLSQSGFAFWSHDISGFEATATPDLYKRWCAFGLLSTHSRLHGSGSYRVPWNFDEQASDVLRFFVQLKCRLMPYLYGQAVLAHERGTPVLRPMMFDFYDDPACDYLDRQYMLGESLVVAPIFNEQGEAQYYLPKGTWTHLLTGEQKCGGWHTGRYDYFSLPLFVRENTLLAMGSNDQRPDYDYAQGVELRLYALEDGGEAACAVPDTAGKTVLRASAARQGDVITLQISDLHTEPSILLVRVDSVQSVEGGMAAPCREGTRIIAKAEQVRVRL